jgi:hypothetical protein
MSSYRKRLTPSDIPSFFGGAVGVLTVAYVHNHNVPRLITLNALWLLSLALIFLRSRYRGGKLLNFPAGLYYGCGIAFYMIGLLMACVYYVVYSNL